MCLLAIGLSTKATFFGTLSKRKRECDGLRTAAAAAHDAPTLATKGSTATKRRKSFLIQSFRVGRSG
jgi:hypothetical protein